ncbi:hypothetical protein BC343_03945 [Mucilaginibacter pedocola]|uniref:Uncharacterized protein n=1 Tax=Mucilaginibacter pedocola TaxID=1792845 RepID=A0A1S9PML6_9SPHI|nr:hypothetical protein BC343_03945 [Mucilaginibacter pedocola]
MLLTNTQSKQEVRVNITVDYSYQPKDLTVVFINYAQVCGLGEGQETTPYDEYCFKRVQNIVVGSFKYKEDVFTLKLGEYFEGNNPYFFIIHEEGTSKYLTFDNLENYGDILYQDFKLIDYSEYKESCEITDTKPLSKKEFIGEILFGNLTSNEYKLYNTVSRQKDINLFLNSEKFSEFLDYEEIRTSRAN